MSVSRHPRKVITPSVSGGSGGVSGGMSAVTLAQMLDGLRYRSATPRDATIVGELVAAGFATYREFAPRGWRPRSSIQEEGEVYDRLMRGDTHARLALDDSALVGVTG